MTVKEASEARSGPPEFDPLAVGRMVPQVELEEVELLGAHFERRDDGAVPPAEPFTEVPDEMGISVEWAVDAERRLLGCALTFGTVFPDVEAQPYEVVARFRLTYRLVGDDLPDEADCDQFVNWNAVFNAWPYWREYLSSTVNRGRLPRFVAPVMRMPRGDAAAVPVGE